MAMTQIAASRSRWRQNTRLNKNLDSSSNGANAITKKKSTFANRRERVFEKSKNSSEIHKDVANVVVVVVIIIVVSTSLKKQLTFSASTIAVATGTLEERWSAVAVAVVVWGNGSPAAARDSSPGTSRVRVFILSLSLRRESKHPRRLVVVSIITVFRRSR